MGSLRPWYGGPHGNRRGTRLPTTPATDLAWTWQRHHCGEGLVRLAGGEYENWTSDDLPDIRFGFDLDLDYGFEVAPDGSVWFSLWRSDDGEPRQGEVVGCDGLARFDGETLDHFLPGRCTLMDIAADGFVWVLAGGDGGKDLYVITPEAVVASQ